MQNLQCVYIVQSKYQLVSAKAVVQIDFPTCALSIHNKQNPLRVIITKGNNSKQNWPLSIFSNTNVPLADSNVFAKFDEMPSLPVQDIYKEKTKCCGQIKNYKGQ